MRLVPATAAKNSNFAANKQGQLQRIGSELSILQAALRKSSRMSSNLESYMNGIRQLEGPLDLFRVTRFVRESYLLTLARLGNTQSFRGKWHV